MHCHPVPSGAVPCTAVLSHPPPLERIDDDSLSQGRICWTERCVGRAKRVLSSELRLESAPSSPRKHALELSLRLSVCTLAVR